MKKEQGILFSGEELNKTPENFKDTIGILSALRKKLGLSNLQVFSLVKLTASLTSRKDFLLEVTSQLSRMRYAKGKTQEEVNDKIGVADRLVNKWECGIKTPSGYLLMCYAEALGCKLMAVPVDLHIEVRELIEKWYAEQEQD